MLIAWDLNFTWILSNLIVEDIFWLLKIFTKNRMHVAKILNVLPDSANYMKSNLKSTALKYFYSFNPSISEYHRKLVKSLDELSSNENIIVTKPDKGTGLVLLKKSHYMKKMDCLLNGKNNFF